MTRNDLAKALFRPDGVALVGASADPAKNTGRPQRFLAAHGFGGRVVPVNPNRAEVQGLPCHAGLAASGEPVDHAFIMVPAAAVAAAVDDCVAAGVTVATIYSDGFAETGDEGRRAQEDMVAAARAGGLRLVGPNSMGVICPASKLMLSVNAVLESTDLPQGRLGVVSQSGSMLGALLSRGAVRGIGFSRMVSIGNEADLGVGEVMDLLVDDAATDAILLFLESVRDGAAIGRAARRAFAADKPVLAYKLGRSPEGRRIAVSHSGALAGEDAAADAFFRAHAIARVDVLESLMEAPPLMRRGIARGRRVAVMTTTGGGAATVVDRLGAAGLEPVAAPPQVREFMAGHGVRLGDAPLVDLTMAAARDGIYGRALDLLLASDACDAVVCVVGSSGQFHPEIAVAPIVRAAAAEKPVAAFRTPEACADGLRAALHRQAPVDVPAPPAAVRVTASGTLAEDASLAVMDGLGIPVAAHRRLSAPDDPCDLEPPLALKVLSPDIPHKTEAGGVRLGIADAGERAAAGADILAAVRRAHPEARVDGLLAQRMHRGLGEVLIGYRRDAQFGPLVVLAAGGVLAEVYGDRALRLAPIDLDQAREMIAEVRGLAPLRGYRGLPPGDLDALADALVRLSGLAAAETVREAEVNPLIVRPAGEGVVAVDGLVVRES